MKENGYPMLIERATGRETPVSGRIFTMGASAGCRLQLPGRSMPEVAAHLLFKEGSYALQVLTDKITVTISGKPAAGVMPLRHGDLLKLGEEEYVFAEKKIAPETTAGTKSMPDGAAGSGLHDLIASVVALLRNSDEEVFTDLVAGVSRILHCDAARVVEEDPSIGTRKTIARYPEKSALDRFSERAIDWAKNAARTVVMHDSDWDVKSDSTTSLEKNRIASVLCAPLREKETLIGYLYLDRVQGNRTFTEEERNLCDELLPLFSEILSNDHERRRQRETIARLQAQQLAPSGGMLYESDAMKNLMALAVKVARTDSPVLVLGETGAGKELVARYVHQASARADKPFRAINCGALPENLIESELFGYEKGAFTGAQGRKIGLFESADKGTVFLDEIGEMPQHLQVKLLRVLQEGEFTRIGGTETLHADVRIVAATNKKLDVEVKEGRFRQDLYFRLNVLTLLLPPLRERGPDIALLSEYFLKKYCLQFGLPIKTLSSTGRNVLASHNWPGNIRELENVIQKAILISQGSRIGPEDLMLNQSTSATVPAIAAESTLRDAREQAEAQAIENALTKTDGNVSSAAKLLDIDRKWLIKKMGDLGINADSYRK
jgi:transcriptional regulator with GAF, ATPase, and Fis domain